MEIIIDNRTLNVSLTVITDAKRLFPNNLKARHNYILQSTKAELRHQKGEGLVLRPAKEVSDDDFETFERRYK